MCGSASTVGTNLLFSNKNCQDLRRGSIFTLITNQDVSLLLCHGCWQKTQGSWVTDKGLYCSCRQLCVCVSYPFPPSPTEAMWRNPGGCYTGKWVCVTDKESWATNKPTWPLPQSETLTLLDWIANKPVLCSGFWEWSVLMLRHSEMWQTDGIVSL